MADRDGRVPYFFMDEYMALLDEPDFVRFRRLLDGIYAQAPEPWLREVETDYQLAREELEGLIAPGKRQVCYEFWEYLQGYMELWQYFTYRLGREEEKARGAKPDLSG